MYNILDSTILAKFRKKVVNGGFCVASIRDVRKSCMSLPWFPFARGWCLLLPDWQTTTAVFSSSSSSSDGYTMRGVSRCPTKASLLLCSHVMASSLSSFSLVGVASLHGRTAIERWKEREHGDKNWDKTEMSKRPSAAVYLYCTDCGVYTTSGGRMEAVAEELVIAFVASAFLIGIIHPPSCSSRQH